ncbi:MAG TPA: C40 family peptidase [Nocardioides sp.]|uniref:C40 family peptidase n=1 Tax=Nocardioides sp. TaxID=35761 RepID=UPI002E361F8B|nr:C40 family peptidase [Nocardioides sp.]HEX3929522.1 C40 family peptidase [Nocardioides sp.]
MHRVGVTALALSLVTGLTGVAAASAATSAGHHVYPSKHQVQDARHRAAHAADSVAGVKHQLEQADIEAHAAATTAEQAAERYNGARWELQQARQDARTASEHATIAAGDARRQHAAYAATVVTSYEMGPSLSPLAALQGADGMSSVVDTMSTLQNAQSAMDHTAASYTASSTLAGVASDQAEAAQAKAARLAAEAKSARDAAIAAANAAQLKTEQIAALKTHLIRRMARLQHVSVKMAQKRQAGIEEAAREAAQRAAERKARREAARAAAQKAAQQAAENQGPSTSPTTPTTPTTPPPAPPAPSGGAARAIAFARSQLGEPYVWGAAGPSSWDCSGLTMGAWRAGGISLPHYSVAQYAESTPISPSALRPGDLVFWGSSGSPSSIYHVAMYVGNGLIIQAPHTGADVDEVSMYSWIAPNFFARP